MDKKLKNGYNYYIGDEIFKIVVKRVVFHESGFKYPKYKDHGALPGFLE